MGPELRERHIEAEKNRGGGEQFSGQPELRPEPGTENLITKGLRKLQTVS